MVNYYSVEGAEFKYYREPESQMIKKAKELEVKSFITDNVNPNIHYYNKPGSSIQYVISVFQNMIYTDYHYFTCTCHSYYKSYVCKHIVKVADIFSYKLKGYTKVEVLLKMQSEERNVKIKKIVI